MLPQLDRIGTYITCWICGGEIPIGTGERIWQAVYHHYRAEHCYKRRVRRAGQLVEALKPRRN